MSKNKSKKREEESSESSSQDSDSSSEESSSSSGSEIKKRKKHKKQKKRDYSESSDSSENSDCDKKKKKNKHKKHKKVKKHKKSRVADHSEERIVENKEISHKRAASGSAGGAGSSDDDVKQKKLMKYRHETEKTEQKKGHSDNKEITSKWDSPAEIEQKRNREDERKRHHSDQQQEDTQKLEPPAKHRGSRDHRSRDRSPYKRRERSPVVFRRESRKDLFHQDQRRRQEQFERRKRNAAEDYDNRRNSDSGGRRLDNWSRGAGQGQSSNDYRSDRNDDRRGSGGGFRGDRNDDRHMDRNFRNERKISQERISPRKNEDERRHSEDQRPPQRNHQQQNRNNRSRNFPRETEDESKFEWGKKDVNKTEEDKEIPVDKEKPNFGLSGKLTEDVNTFNGIVIKYSEPQESRKPKRRWRLYPFKGETSLQTLYIHRQSCYLIGRDRKICDLPIDHPSTSKQHAALQYRLVPFKRDDGTTGKRIRPYVIDLESANGTFINNKKIESKKYIELIEKDVLKFGFSSREYVLLHENSKDDELDDDYIEDVKIEPK